MSDKSKGNPFGPLTYPPAKPGTRTPSPQPLTPAPNVIGDKPYTPARYPKPPTK